jgi:hypothetical protein
LQVLQKVCISFDKLSFGLCQNYVVLEGCAQGTGMNYICKLVSSANSLLSIKRDQSVFGLKKFSQSRPSCVRTPTPAHLATQQRFGVRIHGIESFVETSEVIVANLIRGSS